MFLGVVIGTYSSVFIASPAVLLWRKYFPRDAWPRQGGTRLNQDSPGRLLSWAAFLQSSPGGFLACFAPAASAILLLIMRRLCVDPGVRAA